MDNQTCIVVGCENTIRIKLRSLCDKHYQRFLDNRDRALGRPTRTERYRIGNLTEYRKRKREYAKSEVEKPKRKKYLREWTAKNRERANRWKREYNKKHSLHLKEIRLLNKYGLSLQAHAEMVQGQDGKCKICSRTFDSHMPPYVDHCHKSGLVRGMLCNGCNRKLGWYEAHSAKVTDYLRGLCGEKEAKAT